jgi:hypothetical protein
MTWASAVAAFKTDLTTAAAALNPAISLVHKGELDNLNQDAIDFWVQGWRPSHTGSETLTKLSIERGIFVEILLRAKARSTDADDALEDRVITVDEAICSALLLDRDLGGNAVGLYIEEVAYDWKDLSGQLCRRISFVAWVDLSEVFTVSL